MCSAAGTVHPGACRREGGGWQERENVPPCALFFPGSSGHLAHAAGLKYLQVPSSREVIVAPWLGEDETVPAGIAL